MSATSTTSTSTSTTSTSPTSIGTDGAIVGSVDPYVLHGWLRDGKELAVLDVRELTGFASGHLLLAVPAPRSRLELAVGDLVPRRATRVVVVDGGDGDVAIDAAERLVAGGYEDVHVLVGGTAAWRAAGYELFTGVNSLSKAFGEFVQDTYDPPEITVDELHERFERGDDVLVVDSRPLDEFTRIAIPNGINCPGGELVHRIHDAITSPDQEIVVNCAGRTRAILGAQVLINAGLPNPIRILTDGTSAWEFAGYEPARGGRAQLAAPAPGTPGAAAAARSAQLLRDRFGVRSITHRELDAYRADADRTLYVFDVRDAVEFRAGHLPGSRSVPGGQLLQATDEFVGTHGARLVLVDGPDGVRATSAAAWLTQLGFDDVEILVDAFADRPVEAGPVPAIAILEDRRAERTLDELAPIVTIGADDLASRLAEGARLIDVGPSSAFRDHHIAGARFARRGGLAATLDLLDETSGAATVVLTSADGRLALLAAADLVAAGRSAGVELFVLDRGNEGWIAAGQPVTADPASLLTDADDVYGLPTDIEERRAWYRNYVAWGRQASEQVARDGSITFRAFARPRPMRRHDPMPDRPHFHWFLPTTYDSRQIMPSGTDYQPAPDIDYLADVARAAERNGFESLLTPTGTGCEDAWLVTAALTQATRTIKFLVAFRPGFVLPTLAAQMAATYQRLSNGRLLLNVVTGGSSKEQQAYGDHLDHDERYARTDEFLEVVQGCWAGGPYSFRGRYYDVVEGGLPEPLLDRPEIYFGGASPAAQAVSARHADVQLMFGEPPPMAAERVEEMRRRVEGTGRELTFGIRLHVITRDTAADAWQVADRLLDNMDADLIRTRQAALRSSEAVGQHRILSLHGGTKDDRAGLEVYPNVWAGTGLVMAGGGTALVGSHEQVAERIAEYQSIGIDHFILSGYPKLEETYWFGEHVMPLFTQRDHQPALTAYAGGTV